MLRKEILLDVAAFLDSRPARALDSVGREDLRRLATALVSACYEDLGKEPRLLDGEDARALLSRCLPGRLRKRDPLTEDVPRVLAAYLDHLEESAVVTQSFELRRGVDEALAPFLDVMRAGTNEPVPSATTELPVVHHTEKLGRNDPCFCGSGKKFKKCHGKGA